MSNAKHFRVISLSCAAILLAATAYANEPKPEPTATAPQATVPADTNGGPGGIVIRECGRIQPGPQGCPQFITDDFTQSFFIDNTGGLPFGTRVFVIGILNQQSQLCLPLVGPGIENARVGPCISTCGTIIPGILCNLFQADDGTAYVLQNEGNFNVGDRVWVRGRRVPQLPCGGAMSGPGIADNDIFECYEDCATLDVGPQGCPILVSDNTTNILFVQDIGPFQPGDRVWVQGCLNPESTICGPLVGPGVEDNTIGRCVEECGVIGQLPGAPCATFEFDDGTIVFIENTGNAQIGDRVWVRGCLNFGVPTCGGDVTPTITNNTVGICFEECGTLDVLPGAPCPIIRKDDGSFAFLEDIGDFQPGDRIWVEGCLSFTNEMCPAGAIPTIEDNRIAECFEGCGEVVPGILCNLFIADDGMAYALENEGNFPLFERLWVRGCVNLESRVCDPNILHPAIESNTIGRCFEGCGTLAPGPQGCPTIQLPNGTAFFIENTGNFPFGANLWVQGCLNPNSTLCLPPGGPGVEDNTIGRCIEACGRLIQGPGCILFRADDNTEYWLENTGGLPVGSRLRIRGCAGPDVTPCDIDLPFPSILSNTVFGPLGDMNCDGLVTVSDIGPFVLALTNPAAYMMQFPNCDIRRADINCDGFVTVGDIGLFVRLLTNAGGG